MVIDSFAFRYPLLYLDLVVLAGIAAGYSLLAIWAGVSRWHWFTRASALTLSLLALLPIQAHEPALMLAFALPALTLSVAWLNRRGIGPGALTSEAAAPSRLRFGLRDLLLSVLLVALASFGATILIQRRHDLNWQHLVVGAPSFWLLAVLGYLVSFAGGRRRICALTLAAVILAFAGVEAWLGEGWTAELADVLSIQSLGSEFAVKLYGEDWAEAFVCILLAAAVYALLLAGMLLLSRDQRPAARSTFILVVLLGGLAGICLYWHMVQPSTIERDDPALPNSYPRLLQLAQRVEESNPRHMPLDGVEPKEMYNPAVVAELRAIYEEARRLVRRAGHVPIDFFDLESHGHRIGDLTAFRGLAQSWSAQSTFGKHDLSAAIGYDLSAVELGAITAQRGLLDDALMGMACEEIGSKSLRTWRRLLPVADAREVVSRLIAVDRRREPYEVVAERDRQWIRTSSAWRSRFAIALAACGKPGWTHPDFDSIYETRFRQRDANLRLLITDLAVRCYRSEQGSLPANLQELVPHYLPDVPIDPFSGQPIIYRPTADGFLVYSVGLDGKDDGGRFVTSSEPNTKPFDWGLDFLE